MRAVDYVTNGFGAPVQYARPDPDSAIRQNLLGLPLAVVDAAVETYRKFGPSGLRRAADFGAGIENAEHAFIRMFPNAADRIRNPNAARYFKSVANSILNTAASGGLTPLSSLMLRTYRNALAKVPDSSQDPKMQFRNAIPDWLFRSPEWLTVLANTF